MNLDESVLDEMLLSRLKGTFVNRVSHSINN